MLASAIVVAVLGLVAGTASISPARAQPSPQPTSSTTSTPPTTAPPANNPSSTATSRPGEPTTATPVPTTAPATVPPAEQPPTSASATATTLPSGPPSGFTEEQYRTFVDVVTACGPKPGAICSWVLGWTGNQSIAEAAQWTSDVPVRVLLVVLSALAANWAVRHLIERYLRRLERRAAADRGENADYDKRRLLRMATASASIASAATVAIFTVAAFVALAQLHINLGPLLAGAGIIGVALGFGAQNVVRDLLAGFFVLVEDQYGIGDIIDVGRASGVVESISLRVTKVRDVEGVLWFVPNGVVQEVGNKTQRWARVILDVDVAYAADHHEAARLIKESADAVWRDPGSGGDILEEPELWGVEALGDSSVSIRVAVKSAPADQWKVAARAAQPHQGLLRWGRHRDPLPPADGLAPLRGPTGAGARARTRARPGLNGRRGRREASTGAGCLEAGPGSPGSCRARRAASSPGPWC